MNYKIEFDIEKYGTKADRIGSFNSLVAEIREKYKAKPRISRHEPLLGSWKREGACQCPIRWRRELVMAGIFTQEDHHIVWDRNNKITNNVGAESIWLDISFGHPRMGSMMNPVPKDSAIRTQVIKRVAYAVKWMDELNEAFNCLARMYKDKFNIPILMFSLNHNSSLIECLTLDYEMKVNDTQTAYERYIDYLVESMARRASTPASALTELIGEEHARLYIQTITDAAIYEAGETRYKRQQLLLPEFQDD